MISDKAVLPNGRKQREQALVTLKVEPIAVTRASE